MNIILVSVGLVLAVAGVVVFPGVAHVMLETHPPTPPQTPDTQPGAITVNFATMAARAGLIWLALTS